MQFCNLSVVFSFLPLITKYLFTFHLQNNTGKKWIINSQFSKLDFSLDAHTLHIHTQPHEYTRTCVHIHIYNLGFLLIHSKYTYTDRCISFPPIAQAKRFPGRQDFLVLKSRCERFENRRETKFKYFQKAQTSHGVTASGSNRPNSSLFLTLSLAL